MPFAAADEDDDEDDDVGSLQIRRVRRNAAADGSADSCLVVEESSLHALMIYIINRRYLNQQSKYDSVCAWVVEATRVLTCALIEPA